MICAGKINKFAGTVVLLLKKIGKFDLFYLGLWLDACLYCEAQCFGGWAFDGSLIV